MLEGLFLEEDMLLKWLKPQSRFKIVLKFAIIINLTSILLMGEFDAKDAKKEIRVYFN